MLCQREQLVHSYGDMAALAQVCLLKSICKDNVLRREAVLRKMELMRVELSGPNPSPIERLLIERIVIGGLFVHMLEIQSTSQAAREPKYGDYIQKQIDRAQRRYFAAIQSLAMIRKMALPVLEVKIKGALSNNFEGAAHEVSATNEVSG